MRLAAKRDLPAARLNLKITEHTRPAFPELAAFNATPARCDDEAFTPRPASTSDRQDTHS
ncbi:MAG: hypothetical protein CBB71_17095 [Rhodopirellula sp. TMED11]|nr:MAG: hypothetical protein CBB71_17095 [Rhodopirellula sp. TMED11]